MLTLMMVMLTMAAAMLLLLVPMLTALVLAVTPGDCGDQKLVAMTTMRAVGDANDDHEKNADHDECIFRVNGCDAADDGRGNEDAVGHDAGDGIIMLLLRMRWW